MSEYCDIFPEDPSCAVEEVEEEVVADNTPSGDLGGDSETGDANGDNEEIDAEGDMDEAMMEEMEKDIMEKMEQMDWDMTPSQMWMKAAKLMEFTSINPLMGELTRLMIAIGFCTSSALDLFRYKSDSKYYDVYHSSLDTSDTNWFKLGNLIKLWSYFVVYAIAAFTQIVALVSNLFIMNQNTWVWSVYYGLGLVNIISELFKFLAYEQAYDNKKTATMELIKSSMVEDAAVGAFAELLKYSQDENWKWANWDKRTWEMAVEEIADLEAEVAEWDAEQMAKIQEERGEKKSKDENAADEDADEKADAEDEDAADE